jgi:hypothetical protein
MINIEKSPTNTLEQVENRISGLEAKEILKNKHKNS